MGGTEVVGDRAATDVTAVGHPKILVLLAAFNGAEWIQQQVEDILGQCNVDVALVISDDGSTDGTASLAEAFTVDPRVRLVIHQNPTGSAAQNFLGLIRSVPADGYDFVAFSDQDDIWPEQKLFRASTRLASSGAAGYSSSTTAFWDDGSEALLKLVKRTTASDFLFESAGQGCTYVLTNHFYGVVRNFLIQSSEKTAKIHYHDWVVYALCRTWRLVWLFDQDSGMMYRQHGGNDTGARSTLGGVRKRLGLIQSGWYARQLRLIAELCLGAAPADPTVREWHSILQQPDGARRRWLAARFSLLGGRRRFSDKMALLLAIVAGWV